ncbi:MAG: hypothetical protein AAFS12_04100 [Cyanobacteria bacterium J06632_19]
MLRLYKRSELMGVSLISWVRSCASAPTVGAEAQLRTNIEALSGKLLSYYKKNIY